MPANSNPQPWLSIGNIVMGLVIFGLVVSNVMTLADARYHDRLYAALEWVSPAAYLADSKTGQQMAMNQTLLQRGRRIKELNAQYQRVLAEAARPSESCASLQ